MVSEWGKENSHNTKYKLSYLWEYLTKYSSHLQSEFLFNLGIGTNFSGAAKPLTPQEQLQIALTSLEMTDEMVAEDFFFCGKTTVVNCRHKVIAVLVYTLGIPLDLTTGQQQHYDFLLEIKQQRQVLQANNLSRHPDINTHIQHFFQRYSSELTISNLFNDINICLDHQTAQFYDRYIRLFLDPTKEKTAGFSWVLQRYLTGVVIDNPSVRDFVIKVLLELPRVKLLPNQPGRDQQRRIVRAIRDLGNNLEPELLKLLAFVSLGESPSNLGKNNQILLSAIYRIFLVNSSPSDLKIIEILTSDYRTILADMRQNLNPKET